MKKRGKGSTVSRRRPILRGRILDPGVNALYEVFRDGLKLSVRGIGRKRVRGGKGGTRVVRDESFFDRGLDRFLPIRKNLRQADRREREVA